MSETKHDIICGYHDLGAATAHINIIGGPDWNVRYQFEVPYKLYLIFFTRRTYGERQVLLRAAHGAGVLYLKKRLSNYATSHTSISEQELEDIFRECPHRGE